MLLPLALAAASIDWQQAADEAMKGRSGAAVVLDVDSGNTLAMYHPQVARHRSVPPGSAIKPFTLVALFNEGKLRPGDALICGRKQEISGRRLDCTHPVTVLPLDASAALAYSCNFFFTTYGARLGNFHQTLGVLGLAAGHAETEEQRRLQAIGEWGVQTTPLELAEAYVKLARRRKSREFDAGMQAIWAGLRDATEYGTARQASSAGVRVAGKTGTVRHGAWFAGYAPEQQPRIVVVVFLESGTGGGDAAPAAAKIFTHLAGSRPDTLRGR